MRSPWLLGLLLAGLTAAVFHPVRGHDFVRRDDFKYIVENPDVRAPLGVGSLLRHFTQPHYGDATPLTYLSLQVDHALFGMDPGAIHLVNVAQHGLATLLLFLALARMTGAPGRSAFVAGVFAVHPLHVESVAWAFERKDTLAGCFFMLALYAYGRYAERPGSAPRYAAVFACLALGLLAKPTLVTLPLVLLLLDFWPLGRLSGRDRLLDPAALRRPLLEKLPLLAWVGLAAGVLMLRHGATTEDLPFFQMPLPLRLMNALETAVHHLRESFWPTGLAVFYPHPMGALSPWSAAACAALLAALTAAAAWQAGARPYLLVGWLWYALTLLPVSGIVLNAGHARADRNMYLPLIGLAIALAWSAVEAVGERRAARRALAGAAVASLAALAVAASLQLRHWRDTRALFERAIAVTDDNYLAHYGLAAELRRRGALAEAEAHYRESLRIEPRRPGANFELAELLAERGRGAEAVGYYEAALRFAPESAAARLGLARCLLGLGRLDRARSELESALAQGPGLAPAHALLAGVYEQLGRGREAVAANREALRLDPGLYAAGNNLAWILATHPDPTLRDPSEAVRVAEAAVAAAGPPRAGLLDTLAAAYAAAGRFEEAVAAERRALALAEAGGDAEALAGMRERLASYRAGRAWRAEAPQ